MGQWIERRPQNAPFSAVQKHKAELLELCNEYFVTGHFAMWTFRNDHFATKRKNALFSDILHQRTFATIGHLAP